MDQMFKLSGKGEPSLPPALPTPCGAKYQSRAPTASRHVGAGPALITMRGALPK
jgi:hypothetical protein